MQLRRDTTALLLVVTLIALALPLVAFAAVGWFSRYASDDYCTAGIVLERGFVGAQEYWYTTWSGRFAFFGLVSAIELVGPVTVQLMPALALVASVGAGAWALLPIARHATWPHPKLTCLALSELIVFAVFASTPNLGQSLFWQTGVLTYALPLLLLTLFGGWLARSVVCPRRVSAAGLVGAAALLCFSAGLSETTLAVQLTLLIMALPLVVLVQHRRGVGSAPVVALIVAGIVGTSAAAAILALAPGNAERVVQEEYPGARLSNLLVAARASLRLFGGFSRRFEAEFRPIFLANGLIPFALGVWLSRRSSDDSHIAAGVLGLLLDVLGAAVLVCVSFFPSYWVLGFDPPARIELVAQFFIVCGVAGVGYAAGRFVGLWRLRPTLHQPLRLAVALAALVALAVPLNVALAQVRQVPAAQRYATLWDQDDQRLRAARGSTAEVVVPALPQWWGWDWVGPRINDFPNACVARYYGVPEVRSVAGA